MNSEKHQTYFIRITFAAGFLYLFLLMLLSNGSLLHDEVGHYLISRDAIRTPLHIFDTWGRTFNTLIYIIPAQFGLGTVRLLSITFALLTALITLNLAKTLQVRFFYLVPLFLWFQPWFADLSYMGITQVPFSLAMILGTYLFLRKHPISASCIIGILPLIRHEGIALVGLWACYLLYKKDWRSVVMAGVPLILYNIFYHQFMGTWPLAMYFDSKPTELYGSGAWYHFLIRLFHPRAVGIPIMLLVTCSIIPIVKNKKLLLIGVWYFSYFLLHTIIYRFGLFASGGFKLFLMPLAPIIAIAAVVGIEWITSVVLPYLQRKRIVNNRFINEKSAGFAICIICVSATLIFVKPYKLDREGIALKKATAWIRQEGLQNNPIVSTHVYTYHFLPLHVPSVTLWEKFPPLDEMSSGTIVIWDVHYSDRWGVDLEYLTSHGNEWQRLIDFEEETVIVFTKTL